MCFVIKNKTPSDDSAKIDRVLSLYFFLFAVLTVIYNCYRFPLFFILLATGFLLVALYRRYSNRVFTIKLSFWSMVGLAYFSVNALALIYSLFGQPSAKESFANLYLFNLYLLKNLAVSIFFVISLLGLGRILRCDVGGLSLGSLLNFLTDLGLGMVTYSLYLLLLARVNLYLPLLLVLPLVMSLIYTSTGWWKILISMTRTISVDLKLLELLNLAIITLLLLSTAAAKTRTFPLDYDALVAYLNRPKIIAETGSLLSTTFENLYPYPTEIILSSITKVVSVSSAIFFLSLFTFFSILAVYLVINSLRPEKGNRVLLLATVFSAPAVFSLSIYQSKVEMALVFLFFTCLALLIEWFRTRNDRILFPLCLMLSAAYGVKATAPFFILPFAILITIGILKYGVRWPRKILLLLTSLVLLVSIPLIWTLTGNTRLINIKGLVEIPKSRFNLRSLVEENREIACYRKFFRSDVSDYIRSEDIGGRLIQPIDLLMGNIRSGVLNHSDLGANIFFLSTVSIVTSLIITLRRKKRACQPTNKILLIFIFLGGLTLWYLTIHEVLWYALPEFLLSVIIASLLTPELTEQNKFRLLVTLNNLTVALFYTFIFTPVSSFTPPSVQPNSNDRSLFVKKHQQIPHLEVAKEMGQLIEKDPKVLFLRYNGVALPLFFFKDSYHFLVNSYAAFSSDESPKILINRMKNFGVSHLVLPVKGGVWNFSCGPNDLKKAQEVAALSREVFNNGELGLYELPKNLQPPNE